MVFRRLRDEKTDTSLVELPLDALTGLPDRWQLEQWITQQTDRSQRTGDRFGFYLVSVSNLAQINAGYGSAVGDEVLQHVAEALSAGVGGHGHLSRYLGSEFAVVWPGQFSSDETERFANHVLAGLPAQIKFENFVVPIEIAVAGLISNPDLDTKRLLVEAEGALGVAKSSRRNRMMILDETHSMRGKNDILAVRLQRAFENDDFQLHYQPIVSLQAGVIVGFEAVLRWISDSGPTGMEMLHPGVFLESLRTSPIVVPLHRWILEECMRNVATWSRELQSPHLFGAINLDSSFVQDEQFIPTVLATVEKFSIQPAQLMLDLNGSTIGAQINQMWPSLAAVKAEGVGLAFEDFGVGFGSPDLLRRCHFDVIRLPRTLVTGLGLADEDRIIVTAIIRLAHELGCLVIAEGVETMNQLEILREAKCDLVQGYLFSRPVPAKQVGLSLREFVGAARAVRGQKV